MTVHAAPDSFEAASPVHQPFHPLANPYVVSVVPFFVSEENPDFLRDTDIRDRDAMFEEGYTPGEDSLLQLSIETLFDDHNFEIANRLDGRTGLYVIVDNLDALKREMLQPVLSEANTETGIRELVVETPACLTIFAEKQNNSVMLAA